MKSKLTSLASIALLLLSPIMSAMFSLVPVHAENNWDYDIDDPELGDYDKLLQNAGPSDGIVDWYPTKDAISDHPTGQKLVQQLIELSIATNDKDSNARKVLFNDTTGNNSNANYRDTYAKYSVALGFIAQILDFNNAKSGVGAKLEQAAVAGDNDPQDLDGTNVIRGKILEDPSNKNLGHNISDVLGTAFFGQADDAYAQIYVNGYDNVAQNEANIVREATSSITLVAQSKSTGKKATAIFKLNNKTMPEDIKESKLNNYVDGSVYAKDSDNGTDIAGLNMTTSPQSTIDNIAFSKESTFWIDGKNGDGTVVVPRGTTAKQIADIIAKKQVKTNNTLEGSAPMKAVQAATGVNAKDGNKKIGKSTLGKVSYNHFYQREAEPVRLHHVPDNDGNDIRIGNSSINSDKPSVQSYYNYAPAVAYGPNGPFGFYDAQFREYNNVFNTDVGSKGTGDPESHNYDDVKVFGSANHHSPNYLTGQDNVPTKDGWFGGAASNADLHMIDTNVLFNGIWNTKSSKEIPNVDTSEGYPYDVPGSKKDDSTDYSNSIYPDRTKTGAKLAGVEGEKAPDFYPTFPTYDADPTKKFTDVGKVKHLFSPSSYFKESYDANHFAMNSPKIQASSSDEIAKEISNNGSFTDTSVNGEIKKSFTYEVPVESWVYKSYNNPYSTVMSSGGAQTRDGNPIESKWENSTIQPQEAMNYGDTNEEFPKKDDPKTIPLTSDTTAKIVQKTGTGLEGLYFYAGVYNTRVSSGDPALKVRVPDPSGSGSTDPIFTLTAPGGPANNQGILNKFGLIGTDGLNVGSGNIIGIEKGNDISTNPIVVYDHDLNMGDVISRNQKYHFLGDTPSFSMNPDFKYASFADDSQSFVQVWDKNKTTKNSDGSYTDTPAPLIYNKNAADHHSGYDSSTLGQVDSPNFEAKYYLAGSVKLTADPGSPGKYKVSDMTMNDHLIQTAASKRAYFNSNLYNNPKGEFSKENANHKNNSRFFVSQDFSIGPVSTDMITDPGLPGSGITINGTYYPYAKNDPAGKSTEDNAAKILQLAVKYNDPTQNSDNNEGDKQPRKEFTDSGTDGNGHGTDGTGYKLVTIDDAAAKQGVATESLAGEVAKVTGKSINDVKQTKWVEATLPRVKKNAGKVRINVVIYDKAAVSAPSKQDTKPSFSTTDISGGNDPFNVSFRPYTTTYDDGAVLKSADVPQNFKNLLSKVLVAGNPDLVGSTAKLQQILVSSFLASWQQNDGSFNQTDTGLGVSSPLYLYGGFGISNSDTKNSYAQWPKGYADNSSEYQSIINNYPDDFYRGSNDLKTVNGSTIKGIPFSTLSADVSKVDVTKAGTYPVVYTYTNPNNASDAAKITVPVTVGDASTPVFSFQKTTDLAIHVGDSFKDNDYKVVGSWAIFNKYGGDYNKISNYEGIAKNSDGTPRVTVKGIVDTLRPGIYQLTYKATSTTGAVTEMVRNITVLPKETAADWTITNNKAVGYINYVPGYGIMVYNAPGGTSTGVRLNHGTAWKIGQKAVNAKGEVFYRVGSNQWINGKYVSFSPITTMILLKGDVQIVYKKGYGVNLWKSASTTGGYYPGRKLMHGSRWKTSGKQNGFYKVGKDQWIQGDYVSFKEY
ncbi:immunoglobulin-like domain-containing protein [Xylocopilactobacillus apis]|uniref:Pesticidal crystal protein Cry22Aa Ig-like domain-containing protein n=1 Tax=Xylocopilactobacillus apis TaxID=2932183 RepID=A0AAU9DB98_9LACO|nr:immunoglobulin-like domain-containing protein [Xylocopilactobacillus apis]BDR55456.1 hypothetical protein KIMC2_00180 [Xylocopilactobacillus apis]